MSRPQQSIEKSAAQAGVPVPDIDVTRWQPSEKSKAEMERLASSVEKGQVPASRSSQRESKPNPKYQGGKSRRRRHSKKTKRTRRHHRKH